MKLGNFLSIDPGYKGTGLKRGGRLDRDVWAEFADDIAKLKRTAASISRSTMWLAEPKVTYDISTDDEEFAEGKVLTRLHKRKERNRRAIEKKKHKALQETGHLTCEVCDFDFAESYGELGRGFAECHHTVPISQLTENHRTRLVDLAIVCANCHRMIHKSHPMLSVQELRQIVRNHRK